MSFKKTVAIVATAGALAAISVPALAFENEFHGLYNFNTNFSNFQSGGSGDYNPSGRPEHLQTNNYFEQRGRIYYTAKVSDDLKLVTGFELDTRFGGITDNKYTNSNDSGRLDADGITLETKWVYLDFNIGKNFNTKLGVQPYKDTIKGLFIDADIPAIMTTTKLGAYTLNLGFSRFAENYQSASSTTTVRLGDGADDLFIMDNIFALNKDTKLALSYYFLANYTGTATGGQAGTVLDGHTNDQDILLNTLALSAETKLGPVSLSGFGAGQFGQQQHANPFGAQTPSRYFHGWAANAAAKIAIGPGTLRTAALFTSGNSSDNAAQYRGWITSSVNSYNEGGMMILARATQNSPSSTDAYIRRNVTNIALLTVGFDANLTDKLFLNTNLGAAWAPSSNNAPVDLSKPAFMGANNNSSDYMGTELNLELGYKLYSNLTLKAQAAYVLLGSYYTNSALRPTATTAANPENPYTARLHAQFKF
jgi:hypothetical protein